MYKNPEEKTKTQITPSLSSLVVAVTSPLPSSVWDDYRSGYIVVFLTTSLPSTYQNTITPSLSSKRCSPHPSAHPLLPSTPAHPIGVVSSRSVMNKLPHSQAQTNHGCCYFGQRWWHYDGILGVYFDVYWFSVCKAQAAAPALIFPLENPPEVSQTE
ncbi:hypothetical protein L1887_06054 [Cichorium endivia]|nr:hypothetical protein L1887_06054 [Cichorium endivia]